jgi:DNA-binding response OmpR family regulator
MDRSGSVLVVEDDPTIAAGLMQALAHERYEARYAASAEAAELMVADRVPDVVICDVMLPGKDGLTFLEGLKGQHPDVPVIVLTARADEVDRLIGFERGADDYVTKPFSSRELLARVKARLREGGHTRAPEVVTLGDVKVDLRRRVVHRGNEQEHLTTHEAGTLAYLVKFRGRDVSRDELLRNVWGYSAAITTRTVDNQILKLRKKLEPHPAEPRHILTVHGTGYRFEP